MMPVAPPLTMPNCVAMEIKVRWHSFPTSLSHQIGTTLPHNPVECVGNPPLWAFSAAFRYSIARLSRAPVSPDSSKESAATSAHNEKCLLNYTTFVVWTTSARHRLDRTAPSPRYWIDKSIDHARFSIPDVQLAAAASSHAPASVCRTERLKRFRSLLWHTEPLFPNMLDWCAQTTLYSTLSINIQWWK